MFKKQAIFDDDNSESITTEIDGVNKSRNKQTTILQFFKRVKKSPNEEYESDERSPTPSCFSVSDFCVDSDDGESHVSTKSLYRWKRSEPSKWKVNITKNDRSKCLPYLTRAGLKKSKEPKNVDCRKCRFKCHLHFTEEDRRKICSVYWAMNDYKRQKDFILKCVSLTAIKRRTNAESHKSRSHSKTYFLYNGKRKFWRVCAKFFEKTLCISNGPINTAISQCNLAGSFDGCDKRGKQSPINKTDNHALKLVKQHIESFPTVPGHYVRQSSQKNYLDPRLSILKMHELYEAYCASLNKSPVKINVYRQIFCTKYNLSFFRPKKDQCTTCTRFDLADSSRKEELKDEYDMHVKRKDDCNKAKALDKENSQNVEHFQTATFDLQSVLQIPSSASSPMYYSRKINVYNLTVYEGGHNKKALCYAWNELNGKRGSSEIGTILFNYIKSLPAKITELSFFSDTCGGQNRNQHVAAILLYAVQVTDIQVIEQKFLESGHSYMECDSMHSSIEQVKKYRSVFLMNDWLEIFKAARSKRGKNKGNDPYEVKELKFSDFFDLHALSAMLIKNRNVDEDGKKVSWLNVKCFRYEKNQPGAILFRYDHTGPYKKINIRQHGRPRKNVTLRKAYKEVIPISEAKKKDLIKLCNSGVIPSEIHQWYMNLPTSKTIGDNDKEENDCD